MKELIELAVNSGRKWQSTQTGFIHYCYHLKGESTHYPIPIVENFLFVLALLRTRNAENITEAKELLSRLLYFQNEGFPIYQHDYPTCYSRTIGASLLPIFYWIQKDYLKILPPDLKQRFENAINELLDWTLEKDCEKPAPYPLALKIAACAKVFRNEDRMQELLDRGPDPSWYNPVGIADILTGLQVLYPKISESPWKDFWDHVLQTWDPKIGSYTGPAMQEFQVQGEPQVTAYDYFLGSLTKSFSARAKVLHPVALQAALIQDWNEEIVPQSPGKRLFDSLSFGNISGSVQEVKNPYDPNLHKGFSPLRLLWGNLEQANSFLCQGGNVLRMDYKVSDGVDCLFHIKGAPDTEEREKNRDVQFFVNLHEDLKILVNGSPSTTFRFGETVTLEDAQARVSLTFTLDEGKGDFLGHIMRGNRPCQIAAKGKERFSAYDYQIFLRTIRRKEPCQIKVHLKIEEK